MGSVSGQSEAGLESSLTGRATALAADRPNSSPGLLGALAHANSRAVVCYRANLALRLARDADLSPVQNQPHRESRPIRGRQNLLHVDFDFLRLRVLRESQPIRQPPHMRVDDEGRLAE